MKNLILCFTLLTNFLFAQTVEETYRKSLKEVLKDVETRFQVQLKCDEKLLNNRTVNYAKWRFRSDVEATLNLVLGPLDLVFTQTGDKTYLIEAFQYHRRPVEEGRKYLESLLTLYPALPAWESRKAELHTCISAKLNLSPFPEKTALNPIYANRRTLDGYMAENVAIESLPGVYVSGTLYRPLKSKGPFPAVLVAQGHFELQHYSDDTQILCSTLARMGAVVFSYDMFAKGEESLQFAFEDHRTGLATTMQTLNSKRVLDFLSELPYVDPKRIGMTGASGGGTQTFLMAALDLRIAVSVPVVMVSSWFFGGCPCESGLPVHSCGEQGTNNVEIAAMTSPRPMLIVSDGGDWTANVPEIEFPYLQKIYAFYGKTDLLENVHLSKEGHDYGPSKRQATYKFLAKHLGLNLETVKLKTGGVDESKCTIEAKPAMLVFGENGEKLPAQAIRGIESLKKLIFK
ncbi:MAG: dienelactone hydrolase family protein [Bacteroidota bacterium]|nr:acetylxylan esterase [Odoribacter sp.]MDP3644559.1 dienelactone hydrolase family protein [Bacteroidota bacterium]